MFLKAGDLPFVLLALAFWVWGGESTFASGPAQLSANVQKSPPQIILNWPSVGDSITIYKTNIIGGYSGGAGSWGAAIATLPGSVTSYIDTNVFVGVGYEYKVVASNTTSSNAYIHAGIELPLVENRGKLVLLVDEAFSQPLAFEINRLQQDFVGDGWTIIRHDVSRTNTPANVKAIIKSDYNLDTNNVIAVLLLGHLPVPHSGWLNPDGHGSRPAPTDLFYADMHGAWTDTGTQSNANPPYAWWVNLPADGKYDQTTLPADADLQVGRVDFYDMPAYEAYGLHEGDLLKRYLDKDHAYRTGAFRVTNRGATMSTITGNYCLSQLFGSQQPDEIAANNFFSTFESKDYLWFVKGSGGGAYDYTAGIGATTNFAASSGVKVVFNSWFASYFWEWDVQDAFLRAPLAAKGYSLVNFWSDNPCWVLHHMALGKTIGYSTRISQNNNTYYSLLGYPGLNVYKRGMHMSLMGDPTLRMHVVAPPGNVSAVLSGGQVALNWSASSESGLLGYNVYRAASPAGPFTRLNSALITGTSFSDTNPPVARSYMVRAIKLENSSGSGSYINASQGVFDEQGPAILAADDLTATSTQVVFDKQLDASAAQNVANYLLNNGAVITNATLQSDGHTMILGTSPLSDGVVYTLRVNNVTDQLQPPNKILPDTSVSYLCSQVKEYDPDTNTIALWHLNGTGNDAGSNGYTLALSGAANYAEASPVGPTRQCLQVKDVGDYASVEIPAAQILSGNAFTLEARIFVNAWKSYGIDNADLVSAYQDYNSFFRYVQGIWDDPRVGEFEVYGATLLPNSAAQTFIPMGKWVHIAIEFDGTDKNYVYINKVLKAGPITARPGLGSSSPFTITLGNFDGYIDEVRLSRVLRHFEFDASAPQNLTTTAVSPFQINLSWNDVANEQGFKVERWDGSSAGFVQIAVIQAGVTNYTDSGLAAETQYFYRVRAFNATGNTEYSSTANAITPPDSSGGSLPTLTAKGVNSNGLFVIHIDNPDAVSFSLQNSSNLLNWASILSTTQGGSMDFIDPGTNAPRFYRAVR